MRNNMIEELKRLDVDETDVDGLVGYSLTARLYRAEYETLQLEVPEWLDSVTRKIRREITARHEDARANRLRALDAQIAALATPTERKAALIAEREKLTTASAGQ